MKLFVGCNELVVNEATLIAAVQLLLDSTMQEPPKVTSVARHDNYLNNFKITVAASEPVAIAPEEVK